MVQRERTGSWVYFISVQSKTIQGEFKSVNFVRSADLRALREAILSAKTVDTIASVVVAPPEPSWESLLQWFVGYKQNKNYWLRWQSSDVNNSLGIVPDGERNQWNQQVRTHSKSQAKDHRRIQRPPCHVVFAEQMTLELTNHDWNIKLNLIWIKHCTTNKQKLKFDFYASANVVAGGIMFPECSRVLPCVR